MRPITTQMAQFKAETQNNESLHFESCKGGYFSTNDEYGLKVCGRTSQDPVSHLNLFNQSIINNVKDSYSIVYNAQTDEVEITDPMSADGYTPTGKKLRELCPTLKVGDVVMLSMDKRVDEGVSAVSALYLGGGAVYWGSGSRKTITQAMLDGNVGVYGAKTTDNGVLGNVYLKIQIEYGESASEYEKYADYPTPQTPSDIRCVKAGTKVEVCGTNLFDIHNRHIKLCGSLENYDDTTNTLKIYKQTVDKWQANYYVIGKYSVLAGKTICVSFKYKTSAEANGIVRIGYLASSNIFKDAGNMVAIPTSTTQTNMVATITISNDIDKSSIKDDDLVLTLFSNADGNVTDANNMWIEYQDIQLEFGNKATPYKPYQGNEITTPCDLYEGDIWYPASGKVERHNGVIALDGSMNWYEWIYEDFLGYYLPNNKGEVYSKATSNYFKGNIDGLVTKDNTVYIAEPNIRIATVWWGEEGSLQSFKDWLDEKVAEGNPAVIVYKLRTPITEQYDPQPIYAPTGMANVLQEAVDLTADLKVTMLVRR